MDFAVINETHFISELGEHLARTYNFAVLFYFDIEQNVIKCSLRSSSPKDHCGQLAKQLGGGGHPQAAAFLWTKSMKELIDTLEYMEIN
jgi:nanoRNase/pAp phosphatase (c-di-AMP/oligoRNAs hydrolase)